ELGDGFDRLDRPKGLSLFQRRAGFRQLDVDNIPKLSLCEVSNAYSPAIARGVDPFVVLGVFEGGWIRHRWLLAQSWERCSCLTCRALLVSTGRRRPAFVEGHWDNVSVDPAAAHVDLKLSAQHSVLDRQIRHPDGSLEIRRLCATGHDSYPFAADIRVVAMSS